MRKGRPFQVAWEEDEQTLYELYKAEKDGEQRQRLQALWLLRKGKKLQEVSEIVGVAYRTVQEWVRWYRQGGLEKVKRHRRGSSGGVKCWLSQEQLAALKAALVKGKFKTIGEAITWVTKSWGITYTYWGM